MSRAPLGPVVRHLRQLAATAEAGERSDRQLLADFAAKHDQVAFAVLVRRHGPLVLGVCRQVLRHAQDAEDAFQATFMVLARRAGSIRRAEALVGWLHGVAYRLAHSAKRSATRRRAYERGAQPMSPKDPAWEVGWQEAQALVVEEVERLPPRYRLPFLLCHVEGQSRADAARHLGLKEATVRSRLARACKRLQECLARRGVTLVAVLALGALGEGKSLATVPARLASTTVRAALRYAALRTAATGMASAQVVALADGLLKSMALSKVKIASVLLAAVGILAAGAAAVAQRRPVAPPSEPPRAEAPTLAAPGAPPLAGADNAAGPQAQAENAAPAGLVQVSGRVLGPDGEPLAGARIHLWTNSVRNQADMPERTTADDNGLFRLAVSAEEMARGAKVVARAPGHGPDWVDLTRLREGAEPVLRPTRDDVPVSGRVLDQRGMPVAGASVQVALVGKPLGGNLKFWIDRNIRERSQGHYLGEEWLDTLGMEALDVPAAATTGTDGRFRLTGFGRDRVLTLHIHGPAIEHARLWAVTRGGPAAGWIPGRSALYAAAFDCTVGPPKAIAGTVRDKGTRQPVAGMVVGAVTQDGSVVRTTTDAQGRYRLSGGKHPAYWVVAEGLPYFNATKRVADTPGLEPVAVDFELERGLPITGRLVDKVTGKPLRGWVCYYPLPTNPYRKESSAAFGPGKVVLARWGATGPDGAFSELAIPGPGVLVAGADWETRYAMVDKRTALSALGIHGHPTRLVHAQVPIDPSQARPESMTCDIALEPGRTLTGSVVGPDGEPVSGTLVAGLVISSVLKLETETFTLTGLSAAANRVLVFLDREKKLGKVQTLRGDEAQPLMVDLESLGTFTGRILDANGRPRAGLQVTAFPSLKDRYYENLPLEHMTFQGQTGFRQSLWYRSFTRRQTTTDQDGRFSLEGGIIPGWPYQLFASSGDLGEKNSLVFATDGLSAEPGATKDLGDLHSGLPGAGELTSELIPGKGLEGDDVRPGKAFSQICWRLQPPERGKGTVVPGD